jgi:hypothetical protein
MMSRIEIPIPQVPPLPEVEPDRQPQFSFHEREDGTVTVEAETLQDHIAAFRTVTEEMDDHYWAQAAVAASASKKYGNGEYGKKKIEELADAVELSANYLYKMARTYRTFTENFPREKNVIFAKHVIACSYANPSKALAYVRDNPMSCRDFEAWVSDQNAKKAKRITKERQKAVKTEFLEHLERVEQIIEEDFIRNCPSKDFARRVYEKGWLAEIKFELRQFNRKVNEDLIRGAIEDGARVLQEIRDATSLALSDIEALVGQLVATNEYSWVREGGETDMARGGRRMILHRIGTAIGT